MTGQPLSEERLQEARVRGLLLRDMADEIDRLRAENARLEAERSPDNVRHEEVVRDYVAQLEDLDRERYEAQAEVARLEAELYRAVLGREHWRQLRGGQEQA